MSVRTQHVGKNSQEKEAYRNFLSSKFELDKTVEDKENLLQSDSSLLEEDELRKPKITPKSNWLKIKDFLNNNWVAAFGVALVMLVIGGYTDIRVKQGVADEKLIGIEEKIISLEKEKADDSSILIKLNENFSVFKAETLMELEFMKERLKLISR